MTDEDLMPEKPGNSNCSGDAAAYALGALEPGEAEAFRRHMATCVVCRDEVREFERVANALPLASPRYQVPSELRQRVRRAVRADPRLAAGRPGGADPGDSARRLSWLPWPKAGAWAGAGLSRRAGAWAGALATVAVLVVVGVLAFGGGSGSSGVHVYQASVGRAELRLSGSHGDLIVRDLALPPAGRIYEMWLKHGNRPPTPATLFSVTSRGTADVGLPGDVNGVSTVMVTEEPAGGSRAPTGSPVVVAQVG